METLKEVQNVTVEEIHNAFYNEVDNILAEANIKTPDSVNMVLFEKTERLKALGFSSTKEVKENWAETRKVENAPAEDEKKEMLKMAIRYFSFEYPHYKFITEESVLKLCNKYNLVYGDVDRFIGSVPEKNLKAIEEFKIHDHHACYYEKGGFGDVAYLEQREHRLRKREGEIKKARERVEEIRSEKAKAERRIRGESFFEFTLTSFSLLSDTENDRCPLEIAAPRTDFNMQGMEEKDFKISKIEVPDPIVLQPVFYNNEKHYLIVTAWGDEASDELVVNEKMN